MSIRIPMLTVVLRQMQTYGDDRSKRERNALIFKILVFPLLLSFVLCFPCAIRINSQASNSLITVMAVFIPLLFTALISLHDTRQNLRTRLDNDPSQTTKYEYLLTKYEYLADNTSFILAVAILELILLFIMICIPESAQELISALGYKVVSAFYYTVIIYLLQIILYHLFFIIERLSSLIKATSK